MRQFAQQILPAGLPATTVWGYGAKSRAEQPRAASSQRPVADDRGAVQPAGAGQVDQRTGRRRTATICPHLLPVDPTLHWANPPGGIGGRDTRPTFDDDARPLHAARCRSSPTLTAPSGSATRATATPRRGTCPRRTTSPTATPRKARGTTSSRPRRREVRRDLGPGLRHVPVPEPRAGGDHVVPRPRAGHDPAQRVRRPSRVLHRPRRARGDAAVLDSRTGRPAVAAGPGPEGGRQVPAEQGVPRDPDRDPGPLVQRRRVAVLPRHPRLLRRASTDPYMPDTRPLADLEPGVLRQHDHRQRQHLAVPDRRAAPLPVPAPQRLPVPLPDPRLQPDPRRRGLGDRQRGRLPRRPGQPHRRQRQPAPDGLWPSGPT